MLIVIDAHNLEGNRTGVGIYLFNLIREWEKIERAGGLAGIDFALYFKKEIPQDILAMRFFQTKILNAPLNIQSNALFTHYLMSRAAKKDKPDLLFSPNYVLPIFYSGQSVLTIHDLIYEARPDLYNWPSVWDKLFLRRWGRISAEKANTILVPSGFTKKEIIEHYKLNPDKIIVTALAADSSFGEKIEETEIQKIKERYGIYGSYILYAGSIFNRRHLPEIIQAFEGIFSQFPGFQLVIGGTNHTNPHQNIEKIILTTNQFLRDTFKIQDRLPIIHFPYINHRDLARLYQGARASIYLSDYEGFGLPLLESMASGAPVITSKQEALMESVGDAALFVENNKNVDEISQKMTRIFSDDILHNELKQKGIAQAVKFSWARCAEQTLTVFKKLLAK